MSELNIKTYKKRNIPWDIIILLFIITIGVVCFFVFHNYLVMPVASDNSIYKDYYTKNYETFLCEEMDVTGTTVVSGYRCTSAVEPNLTTFTFETQEEAKAYFDLKVDYAKENSEDIIENKVDIIALHSGYLEYHYSLVQHVICWYDENKYIEITHQSKDKLLSYRDDLIKYIQKHN